jgi:hypothetical protein
VIAHSDATQSSEWKYICSASFGNDTAERRSRVIAAASGADDRHEAVKPEPHP